MIGEQEGESKEFPLTAAADTGQRRVNALMHGQGPSRNQQGGRV